MSYIGQPPVQEFASPPSKDSFTGDGSTTTFDLAQEVAHAGENALEVFINNVRQEPGSCLTLLIKTSKEFSPAETTSCAKSKVVVLPSPVKTSFVGAEVNS